MPQILTAKGLFAATAPDGRDRILFDGAAPGLCLRIRRLPDGRVVKAWLFRYRRDGKRRTVQFGVFPDLTLAKARAKAAEARDELDHGREPVSKRDERAQKRAEEAARRENLERNSVDDLTAAFTRDHLASLSPKSSREWQRQIRQIILPAWSGRPVRSIARRDAIELLAEVRAERGPVAANRLQALLSRLWRYACETDRAESSPVFGLRTPADRKSKPRERVLRGEELRRVWEACGETSFVTGRGLRLVLATAARPGEVCGMRWRDIQEIVWPDGTRGLLWQIPGAVRKSRTPLDLPLSDLAREVLEELRYATGHREHVLSLHGPDRPLAGLAHAARPVKEISGVTDWVPHDLRRTAATLCADAGVPVGSVELLLGHAFDRLVQTYQRSARLPELRHAARVLEGEIRRALAGEQSGATVLPWRPEALTAKSAGK